MTIAQLKVKELMDFPILPDGKLGRVITKHFTNLSYLLKPNQYALLNFLIYNSSADNSVRYSTGILEQYRLTIEASQRHYKHKTKLWLSEPTVKKIWAYLVEKGLLLPLGGKDFLINPCLTFSKLYVKQDFYKEWVGIYQDLRELPEHLPIVLHAQEFTQHVNKNYTNRKRNS